MFNLDEQIAEWRRQMLAGGINAPVPMDELESHLRDDVEQQMRLGSGAQEAFETAIGRIGQADLLEIEFAKGVLTKEARERKLLSIFLLIFGTLYSLFVITCVFFKLGSFASNTPKEQALSLGALAFTVLLGVSTFSIQRFLPVISNKRVRTTIYIFGGIAMSLWLVIFYHVILMRFDFTISQLVVACFWGMSPIGAFTVLVIGLDKAAFQKNRNLIRD